MRFVPAGEFEMGSDSSEYAEEEPGHTVYLDDYYIDKYEVTNARYKACVDAGVCQQPNETSSATRSDYYGNPEFDGYPVIYVDWDMAATYCEVWRGSHLPTEAQWEKAARGSDGRSYPWGEGIDASLANYHYAVGDTTAVGTYEVSQSPYGVYDMSGNVWEWVTDWYDENYYETLGDLTDNPTGPSGGQFHVLRGGSWINEADFVRTFTRGWNDLSYFDFADFGFRCARDATP
jgi:formylglycine-generating enzyme required for sulfatase activity